jgi:hypothetical protein
MLSKLDFKKLNLDARKWCVSAFNDGASDVVDKLKEINPEYCPNHKEL